MMFSEEPRFANGMTGLRQGGGQIQAHSKHTTHTSIGPGVYHTNDIENQRNGWGNRSFSKRQPMTPPLKGERGDYVVGAVLHKGQYVGAPLSTHNRKSPGVGVYTLESSFGKVGSSPMVKDKMGSTAGRLTCPSPRDGTKTVVLPNGLLATSIEANNQSLGPGAYNVPSDFLNKPSHNKRVKGHNRTRSDQSTRSVQSSQSSLYSYSPSRNGMSTPRSNSSGRRSSGSLTPTERYSQNNSSRNQRPESYTFDSY